MNAHLQTTSEDYLRQRFRSAREAKGWTQADLADHLEVHWVTISKIERGVIAMSREWITRLTEALGVTVELSFGGGEGAEIIHLVSTADGKAIREAREALGWSQAKLAKRAGTYQQQVDRVERGAVANSRVVPAIRAALGIDLPVHSATPGAVQPRELALSDDEAREGEVRTAVDPSRVSDLRDEIETAYDLMTALDKTGDGIGGDVGHGVSAVALAARAALDNARDMIRAMEGSR